MRPKSGRAPRVRQFENQPRSPTSEVGSVPSENTPNGEEQDQDDVRREIQQLRQELREKPGSSTMSAATETKVGSIKLPKFNPSHKNCNAESWCEFVDAWVETCHPTDMEVALTISSALEGEASSWLVSAKPTKKSWVVLRTEFLAVFQRRVSPLEQLTEAVLGRTDVPPEEVTMEDLLQSIQTALTLIRERESDEALAVLMGCFQASNRFPYARRRFETDLPKNIPSFCLMMEGKFLKRPALYPTSPY
ncbi:hypothetical protein NQ315_002753 [Exocentrus adspersus]|uniref:Gag protein n=1 Tax=Exocentrus adspersus TaxID=1586481 RepID=A0AAV8VKS7_9CUCU|nr:hypothetical protein NQ315_002753 [Exocentrus adspersus]